MVTYLTKNEEESKCFSKNPSQPNFAAQKNVP